MAEDKANKPKIGRPKGSKDKKPRVRKDNHMIERWDNHKNGGWRKHIRNAREVAELNPIDIASPGAVSKRIMEYFDICDKYDTLPTVAGMCLALGIDTKTFWSWQEGITRDSTHSHIAKTTRQIMNTLVEGYMYGKDIDNLVGIFTLKSHFGYQDESKTHIIERETVTERKQLQDVYELYNDPEIPAPDSKGQAPKVTLSDGTSESKQTIKEKVTVKTTKK